MEDEAGHASLITRNFRRAGIENPILQFSDGDQVLDFLFGRTEEPKRIVDTPYILLLDVRMPRTGGGEVLKQIRSDEQLAILPIIMFTTTDDPKEIDRCHRLGCSAYITKPIDAKEFIDRIQKLAQFLRIIQIPVLWPPVANSGS